MNARRAVVDRLIPALRRYARSLVADRGRADDLVAACLEHARVELDQAAPDQDLRPLLFTILRNLFVDQPPHRTSRRLGGLAEDAVAPIQPLTPRPSCGHQDLRRAFEALPAVEREALTLIVMEELSYEAAAGIARVEVDTMRERVSSARGTLCPAAPQVPSSPERAAPDLRRSA